MLFSPSFPDIFTCRLLKAVFDIYPYGRTQSCVQELSVAPSLFPNDLLVYQASRSASIPLRMHRYYRIMALVKQYGAGRIPQTEWEALENWRFTQ